MNRELVIKYLKKSLLGSEINLNNQAKPMYSKNFGAKVLLPDIKSIAAPIPIETQFIFL